MISQNQIKAIAADRPTPFYLYSEDDITKDLQYLNSCFSWQSDYRNYFPMKDNPNPAILKLLWDAGSGILACGRAELLLAKRCGFMGSRLMYQPVTKDAQAEQLASELETCWLLTSPKYLPSCPVKTVFLRVYPDHGCVSASDLMRIKSGLPLKQLIEILQTLKIRNVPNIGLELQMKAFDLRPQAYVNKARILLSLMDHLKQRTGVSITICNLGDGPGHVRNPELEMPELSETALQIKALLDDRNGECPLIHTGFGRQIMAQSGALVTKVTEIRHLQQSYLVLDASYGQFIRPALLSTEHDITVIPAKRTTKSAQLFRIIGQMPDDLNRLHPGKVILQAEPGDFCIIHDVGCGAHAMPMLHRFQGICPEYLLCSSGEVALIGRGKSDEEIMEFLTSF